MRASPGQASVEWIGLVALLVVLMGVGAGVAQAGFLGRHITREWARALCLVRHGDCRRDQEPCTVSADRRSGGLTVDVFFVRLGGGTTAIVERLSDGTLRITRAPDIAGGVQAGLGVEAAVHLGPVAFSVGGELEAAILARARHGRSWIVRDDAAAAALLRRLARPPGPRGGDPAPPPDITYGERVLDSSIGVSVGVDGPVRVGEADAGLLFDKRAGTRIDHRTGRRTVYVRAADAREARVAFAGGVLGTASGEATETYAVEFDAAGRPLDLQIIAAGPYRGSADLPASVSAVQGLLAAPAGRGRDRVYEVTAHLDLTEPENLAAARDLLAELARQRPHLGRAASASAALRRRFATDGTVEARVLEATEDAKELAADAAVGMRVGGAWSSEHGTTHLLRAASRGLDGQWLARDDCAAAA